MNNTYYYSDIEHFLEDPDDQILNQLSNEDSNASAEQRYAWGCTVRILKKQLSCFRGMGIAMEYTIPRINTRIDVVLLYRGIVFVLEFKCGEDRYTEQAYNQTIGYAYDLHFCHEDSADKLIVPIEVATKASEITNDIAEDERVINPILCN